MAIRRTLVLVKRVPGEKRNQPCICGSGLKTKKCSCKMYSFSEVKWVVV